jgi:hypothetical protein
VTHTKVPVAGVSSGIESDKILFNPYAVADFGTPGLGARHPIVVPIPLPRQTVKSKDYW